MRRKLLYNSTLSSDFWRQGRSLMDEDSDFAFQLQLQEALQASLRDAAPNAALGTDLSNLIQDDHLDNYERELLDHYKAEVEAQRLRLDFSRQIHDRAFAWEIAKVPEEEWLETGGHFNRPYGEGSSTSDGEGLAFRVYVKGLCGQMAGAIGVAICDENDGLLFEMSRGFSGKEYQPSEALAQVKALVEGLDVAAMMDLNKLTIITDCSLLYQYITGRNPPMTANVATLSKQINVLWRKFPQTGVSLVPPEDIKFAHQLARNALALQLNHSAGSSGTKNMSENCSICLEDAYVDQIFQIPGCQHNYCNSCMTKHVQFKLLQGVLPKCPHENCKSELKLESCQKFLTPELFDMMSQRVKEASIPAEEKIYCPYPKCSALLSRADLNGLKNISSTATFWCRNCPKCSGAFCMICKVPWHSGMSCTEFIQRNPYPSTEDRKLKSLASENLWRQCPKCHNMVSLAAGCYHIYCRCGHEFCYKCGAEWKKKKATCTCPIWDEHNIEY